MPCWKRRKNMATRSHIRFIQGSQKIQLFKFHDGDPEYMNEHFTEFFKLVRNFDIEEIVPSFITFTKIYERKEKTIKEFLESEWHDLCLEVYMTEVSDDLPSDIEYFYTVDLDKKLITEKWTKYTKSFAVKEAVQKC
jgi:hypothetical protein